VCGPVVRVVLCVAAAIVCVYACTTDPNDRVLSIDSPALQSQIPSTQFIPPPPTIQPPKQHSQEMAYIHAEGYSGGALKHGPFALIEGKVSRASIGNIVRWKGVQWVRFRLLLVKGGTTRGGVA
jgi:hypothetical protein